MEYTDQDVIVSAFALVSKIRIEAFDASPFHEPLKSLESSLGHYACGRVMFCPEADARVVIERCSKLLNVAMRKYKTIADIPAPIRSELNKLGRTMVHTKQFRPE